MDPPKPYVPDWVAKWAFPEFENTSPPADFEREQLSEHQAEIGTIYCADFLACLKTSNTIKCCLSLDDGVRLIDRNVLSKWFPRKHLFLWRSTACDNNGNILVPWIQNISGQSPIIRWWSVIYNLPSNSLTIIFDQKLLSHFVMENAIIIAIANSLSTPAQ